MAGSGKLPHRAKQMMASADATWYLSAVSIWEVMPKHQVHPDKMVIDAPTFERDCEEAGFRILPLETGHIFEAANLPTDGVHKDPLDRMLLAQARYENFSFFTHDRAFAAYHDRHVVLV